MDSIITAYTQKAQDQLARIEKISQAFEQQCTKLKLETEERIGKIDPKNPAAKDLENRQKLKLKQDLQQALTDYEKALRQDFGLGLIELEKIYHQKELQKMQEIEAAILTM